MGAFLLDSLRIMAKIYKNSGIRHSFLRKGLSNERRSHL